MKRKRSSGVDGLNQEQLILGSNELASPLSLIINESIKSGIFPSIWKEALVTPVLKKVNPESLSNYRPVSCLPAASKLLESVICEQMSRYLEENNLLPPNQHEFRPNRSTMTAWEDIQLDWAKKSEGKDPTGVSSSNLGASSQNIL